MLAPVDPLCRRAAQMVVWFVSMMLICAHTTHAVYEMRTTRTLAKHDMLNGSRILDGSDVSVACDMLSPDLISQVQAKRFKDAVTFSKVSLACWAFVEHAILNGSGLRKVEFEHTRVPAAKYVSLLIDNKTAIQDFLLSGRLGDEDAAALAQALKVSKALRSFTLSSFSLASEAAIGDDGARALAEALEANELLQRFSLSSYSLYDPTIGDAGAVALAKALEVNAVLKSFVLSSTSVSSAAIGDAGAEALGEALAVNTALRRFDLSSTARAAIGNDGAEALARALEVNTALRSFALSSSSSSHAGDIGDDGARAFARALGAHQGLRNFTLTGSNNISPAGAQAFADALRPVDGPKVLKILEVSQDGPTDRWGEIFADRVFEFLAQDKEPPTIIFSGKVAIAVYQKRLFSHFVRRSRDLQKQARYIQILACLCTFLLVVIASMWNFRNILTKKCTTFQEKYFPEKMFFPGLSDQPSRGGATELSVMASTSRAMARRSSTVSNMVKFDALGTFRTGRPRCAAGGLVDFLGVTFETLRNMYQDPSKALLDEWEALPEATIRKVADMRRPMMNKQKTLSFLYYILYEAASGIEDDSNAGDGLSVIRDEGRDGWTLADFVRLPQAQEAGLREDHIIALRVYTSAMFQVINGPFRDVENQNGFAQQHPVPVTCLLIAEGLKKLRQLEADQATKDGPTQKVYYRGMKNLRAPSSFMAVGGTELAPMSTSTSQNKVGEYSQSDKPLVVRVVCDNFMEQGSDISWLSLYPGEQEVLYPPLTFLEPVRRRRIANSAGWVIDVKPHIS
ncbi:unnamed protein product [Prorocentrum cordatum]|uniref:NAD(P)(+)--arginine ADP-ribosyltransferase n=1 Tax=Prorocentrum cordatum TaxID=2364126 RepID=A0ABN9QW12_9DINO|nr:unnamed protein product [Polarella glacialis]